MNKLIKKIIVCSLIFSMMLSLAGCGVTAGSEAENIQRPDFPGMGENEGGMWGVGEFEEETAVPTAEPITVVSPNVAISTVNKISNSSGVSLYSYQTTYTPTASNYLVIKINSEELLSKDLFITEIAVADYLGEYDYDDEEEEIVGSEATIEYPIQINETTLLNWENEKVGNLVVLDRDIDGIYSVCKYENLSGFDDIYIGLPVMNAGTYDFEVTFSITDSEDAYSFGYFNKEIGEGEEFTLYGTSKVSKAKAAVYVNAMITEYLQNGGVISSVYTDITNDLSSYLTVEVGGKSNSNATNQLTVLAGIDDVYVYLYNSSELDTSNTKSTSDMVLVLSENDSLNGRSYNSEDEIAEIDIMWVNYEFTIENGKNYVFDTSSTLAVKNAMSWIFEISYLSGDFRDGKIEIDGEMYENSYVIEYAIEIYEELSSAQKAYLSALNYDDISSAYGSVCGSFINWFGNSNFNGKDLVLYLESAKDFLNQLEVCEDFYSALEKYGMYSEGNTAGRTFSYNGKTFASNTVTNVVNFNSEVGIMADNLSDVLNYIAYLSNEEVEILQSRAIETYAYIKYCEDSIVPEIVTDVLSTISALIVKYQTLDLLNQVYFTADNDELGALKVAFDESFFEDVDYAYLAYKNLSPENQDIVNADTSNIMQTKISDLKFTNCQTTCFADSVETYGDALMSLVDMKNIACEINGLLSYVDSETAFETTVAKERYDSLIFGNSGEGNFYLSQGYCLFLGSDYVISNTNFAVIDIVKAYAESDEVMDDVISEYKSFIDLLSYIEEYKNGIANEFASQVYSAMRAGDYSEEDVVDMKNVVEDYKDMIMNEITETSNTDYSKYNEFSSDAMINVIKYLLGEGFENIDEAKELVANCFDIDNLVEEFITARGYEEI